MSDAPEPIAQGSLAQTPFAHVLLHCHHNKMNGTLVCWPEAGSPPDTRQDRILFQQGMPTAARLAQAAGALDRGLLPIFGRRDAPYAFYAEDLVTGTTGAVTGTIDPYVLLAASLRGPSREDAIEQVLARLGPTRLRIKPGTDLKRFALDAREQTFLDVLRAAPATIAQLTSMVPDAKLARRTMYLLAITKSVEPYEGTPASGVPRVVLPPDAPPKPVDPVAPQSRSAAPGPASKRPGPPPVPPMPPALDPERQAAWKEIAQRYERVHDENFFIMLGIPRDSGAQAVRDAYFELAKKWHPDRLHPDLAELKPHVERIFHWLTEARDTLGDDDKRAKYIKLLSEGGGTPAADQKVADIVGAAMEFQKAEVLARRGNWMEAIQYLDRALELNQDEADFHALRGWLLFQIHSGPNAPTAKMLAAVDEALKINDRCERAHYYKGMILKRLGRHKDALASFRRAAEINPKNVDAVREVRLAQMRGNEPNAPKKDTPTPPPGGSSSGGGVFSKLFGGGDKDKKKP